jgi:hypothetical protein
MSAKKKRGGRNVVVFHEPKFKPMPGELTPAVINGATLPVKVEAAKRAIAACCDLSELLTWKDKLAALAAAAKMARMPEMARDVNRVHKEAIFRMGELLTSYSNVAGSTGRIRVKSERSRVIRHLGISPDISSAAVRLQAAPIEVKRMLLENDKVAPSAIRMVQNRAVPKIRKDLGKSAHSDAARLLFQGVSRDGVKARGLGLHDAATSLRGVGLNLFAELTPEEKQRAKKLIVEMQEILDEMDRRLGDCK